MSCVNLKCVKLIGVVFAGGLLFLFLVTSNHYKDVLSNHNIEQLVDIQTNPYLQARKSIISNDLLDESTKRSTTLPLITDLPASLLSPWFNSISTNFVEPKNLQTHKEGYIHIAVLLKNITAANNDGFKLRIKLSKWLNSLVTNTNRMPIHIIFLTDRPGIMAIRMLWFEVMPPFPLYNHLSLVNTEDSEKYMTREHISSDKKVMRFQAEFVDIDEITKTIYNKTLTMQKNFNHPNAKVQFSENVENPLAVIYFES